MRGSGDSGLFAGDSKEGLNGLERSRASPTPRVVSIARHLAPLGDMRINRIYPIVVSLVLVLHITFVSLILRTRLFFFV